MKVTQPRYNPHKRVQIRAFFAEGVDKLHLPWAVEALPILLHLSLSLFFVGLAIFLFNINHTVFKAVISWLGVCASLYVCMTFMPVFRHDSPYYAPLSSSAWFLYSGTLALVLRIFRWIVWSDYFARCFSYSSWKRVGALQRTYDRWALQGLTKTAEEMVGTVSSEMVGRALKWTFESLYEDGELERFFASIPGFCSSKVVDDTQRSLAQLDSWTSAQALEVFLEHTWSSSLLSDAIKQRRLVICVRAADAARLYFASKWILRGVFSGHFRGVLQSIEMGRALRSNSRSTDSESGLCAQSIVASIIASVPKRDSDWFALAMDQLGVSEAVLRDYVSHGDSVLLANLTHITRQIFLSANRDLVPEPHSILRSVSQFDARNALPELQHEFCALWNEIVLEVQTKGAYTPILILVHTRHIFSALHQGADEATPAAFLTSADDTDDILYQPFSYSLCNNPGHWLVPPSQRHELVDATISKTAHVLATPPPATLRHRDAVATAITTKPSLNNVSFPAFPTPCPSLTKYDLDRAATCAKHGTADTSIPSTIHAASALQCDQETNPIPLPVASDYTLPPFPIPAPCSAVPVELHPPADVVVTGIDGVPQRPASLSAAASLPITIVPQLTSSFDPNVPMSVGYLDVLAHDDDAQNLKSPSLMEVPRQPHRSPPAPDITANTLQSEDYYSPENLASS
jgi:hypothetical protein